MTLEHAKRQLLEKIPEARQVDIDIDIVCKRDEKPTVEFTATAWVEDDMYQAWGPSLAGAVAGVLAKFGIDAPKQIADMTAIQDQIKQLAR